MIKKKAKARRETGMVVRRETRVDMAEAWVRNIAREEVDIWRVQTLKAVAEITRELNGLRVGLESLKSRSGEFTGMTETETSDLVAKLVKARISYDTIHDLVDQVLRSFPPIEHASFRARLGISPDTEANEALDMTQFDLLQRFVSLEVTTILLKMLLEALPLARRTLIDGGVELIDQECFWEAYRNLSEYFDPDAEDLEDPAGLLTILRKVDGSALGTEAWYGVQHR